MSTFQASKINASNYYTDGNTGYLAPASGTAGQVLYRLGGAGGVGWTDVAVAGATGAFQQAPGFGAVELVQSYGSSFNVNLKAPFYPLPVANSNGAYGTVTIGDGNTASGGAAYAIAMGLKNNVEKIGSVAIGERNSVTELYGVAMGYQNTAGGTGSIAMGYQNTSGGTGSIAMGNQNTASGHYSVAMGNSNNAQDLSAVAMGKSNTAYGPSSVAMGEGNTAYNYAVAMGEGNFAFGEYSVAMGRQNTAQDPTAVAMGRGNTAGGEYSVAMGYDNSASSQSSVAIGQSNTALAPFTITMGYGCAASDSCAVALGRLARAGETAGATGIGFAFGGGSTGGNCFTITNNNNLLPDGSGGLREAPGFVGLNLDPGLDMNATPNGNYPLFIGDNFAQGGSYPQYLPSTTSYYKLPPTDPAPGGVVSPSPPYGAAWSNVISSPADNVGIYIDNGQWIYTGGGLMNPSDERIKENITTLDTSETLEKIRTLRPVSYTLIKDRPNPYLQYGYLAQEVKELIPQALGPALQNEWICSEMRLSTDHSWSGVTGVAGYNAKLTIHDLEGSTGNQLYRFYVADDDEEEQKKEVAAEESDPKSFLFDNSYNKVFVWGKQVNDFHTLDYTKVNTFAIPAIQELDKQLTAEKAKNAKLEARLAALEERVTTLESN